MQRDQRHPMIRINLEMTYNTFEQMGINQTEKRTKKKTLLEITLYKKDPLEQKNIRNSELTENVFAAPESRVLYR